MNRAAAAERGEEAVGDALVASAGREDHHRAEGFSFQFFHHLNTGHPSFGRKRSADCLTEQNALSLQIPPGALASSRSSVAPLPFLASPCHGTCYPDAIAGFLVEGLFLFTERRTLG